jgi:excinuclease ABC subunit B
MAEFKLVAPFKPTGNQPECIERLAEGVKRGYRYQTLLGVTGSGKTFTVANLIERMQRPTLVVAHNKTLAAQLCMEFREFFPENHVAYFVSYYDYYQPEAYVPQTDTYIEKEAEINEEIDRLRHYATQSVMEARDVIVVASVSCIYSLGSPQEYRDTSLWLERGKAADRDGVLRRLVHMQFNRNDFSLSRGSFRARGDTVEIYPADAEEITRVEFFGDEVERITVIAPLTGEVLEEKDRCLVFPATHYVAGPDKMAAALEAIEKELEERLASFRRQGKLLEAQRLEQRTRYDLEMLREVGYCTGIENYSRYFDGRAPGEPPYTLLDYFPEDLLVVADESHQTIPQLHAMSGGERSRKDALIEHGFRLPSAYDNRPLSFQEFEQRVNQVIFTSATPGRYELEHSEQVVESLVRPTGLLDPAVEVRPTRGQVEDLVSEVRGRVERGQRVLVTTLTKRMAEDLAEYLEDLGIKVHYLHSDVETLERTELLRDLRLGRYDVLVGINLLREGLDLPEVSLVAILDADKEGFLRSETSLVQTMGRAARHEEGQVIMYADGVTEAMQAAIRETLRRRAIQEEYNRERGIVPRTIVSSIKEPMRARAVAEEGEEYEGERRATGRESPKELSAIIRTLEAEMREAAAALEFERAARLRDEIAELKKALG